MRILIVEDDNDVATELNEQLSSAEPSIDTVIAGSRSSGIEALRRDEFDFIICDLRLPPYDGGVDTAEAHGLAVHSEARTVCPGTPCLFFTGYGSSSEVLEQLSSGGIQDILGTGEQYSMTRLLTKDKFRDCLNRLESFTPNWHNWTQSRSTYLVANSVLIKLKCVRCDCWQGVSEGRALQLVL